MRIRLSATRSPPCLDAGSRGFAKLEDPRERFPYSRMSGGQRRRFCVLSRRVNYMAANATAPDRVPASGLFRILDAFPASELGKGDRGPSRSPVSVIGHCQRRFRQTVPGRSRSGLAARPAQGMPARRAAIRRHAASHAQRSEHGHEAARLLARQGSPVAKRCAHNGVAITTDTINPQEIATTMQHVSVPIRAAARVASRKRTSVDKARREGPGGKPKAAARARSAAGQCVLPGRAGASEASTRPGEAPPAMREARADQMADPGFSPLPPSCQPRRTRTMRAA